MGQKRRWNFPSNNFGQIFGIADSVVETFKGTPMKSLAREICQNSLDANDQSGQPTKIEFKAFRIAPSDIPDFEGLYDALKRSLEFWSSQTTDRAKFFLRRHSLLQKTPKSLVCVLVTTTQQDSREREKNITLRGVT